MPGTQKEDTNICRCLPNLNCMVVLNVWILFKDLDCSMIKLLLFYDGWDYQLTAISSWVWLLSANVPVSQTMPIPRDVGIKEPLGRVGRWAATMT